MATPAPTDLTLGEAAREIGVSVDTLRRWERAGKFALCATTVTAGACRAARSNGSPPARAATVPATPVRAQPVRRQGGLRRSRRRMALVEIAAGPHRIIAAITRDAVDELASHPASTRRRR